MRLKQCRAVPVLIAGLALAWPGVVAADSSASASADHKEKILVVRPDPCPQELEWRVNRDMEERPDDTDLLLRKAVCQYHKEPDYGLSWWEQAYQRDGAYSLYRLARFMVERSYDDDEIRFGIVRDAVKWYEAVRGATDRASGEPPPDGGQWQRIVPRAAYWIAGWYSTRFIDLIWGDESYRQEAPHDREGKRPYEPAKALEHALRHADTCISAPESAFTDRAEHAFYSGGCGKQREALLEIRDMEPERLAAASWCRSRDKSLRMCVVHDRVMVKLEARLTELRYELRDLHRSYLGGKAGAESKPDTSDDGSRPAKLIEPADLAASTANAEPERPRETVPSEVRERFEAAWRRWKATGIADYRMWIERNVRGRVAWLGPFVVDVRDGKRVRVAYAADGGPVPEEGGFADLPTIEDLFEYLKEAIESGRSDVKAVYHPLWSYPLWTGVRSKYSMDTDTNYVIHGLLADR